MPADAIPDLDAWEAWHPEEVARRLHGIDAPWCVAGGWALDLWHGRETRPHEDLEIATTRDHFEAFRGLLFDLRLYAAGSGRVRRLGTDEPPPEEDHQCWVLDPQRGKWRLDIFLEPGDDATWICRRDGSIRLPRAEISERTEGGIPYLLPQIVLLFKAKATRLKDEADFETALPRLEPVARAWLSESLARIYPSHPWIARLAEPSPTAG